MAGAPGRRGMDPLGNIVVPNSPWISFKETLEIATGELLPVNSSFAIRYNTVLNLWDPPHGNRVRAHAATVASFSSDGAAHARPRRRQRWTRAGDR